MKHKTNGNFKEKINLTRLLICIILLSWLVLTGGLYLKVTTLQAQINEQKAFTKYIELKGLEHWNTAQVEPEYKVAKVTAYSCGGIKTEAELDMNCPSLRGGNPRTATGTAPIPYKTMACDRSLLGQTFTIKGIGDVTCTDTGGAIKGEGRFDIYVYDINEALSWGTKYVIYKENK